MLFRPDIDSRQPRAQRLRKHLSLAAGATAAFTLMPWNKPLAYDLPLKDGRVLHTLHDARHVFAGVTHDPPMEHAIELLIRAAETGEPDDVTAATNQVATVLHIWRMMADD